MTKNIEPSFSNSGEFLDWWLKQQLLPGKAEDILLSYYSNYRREFDGYLKKAWTDRHFELDEYLKNLNGANSVSILDLGCGTGSVSLYLAWKLQGRAKVLGIDINRERLYCASERLKLLKAEIQTDLICEFRTGSLFDIPPEETFDLIYMEETFHHLEPRRNAVKKIVNLLKDEGLLIISEINALNPFMQALLIKRRGFNTVIKKIDEHGHSLLYGNERIIPAYMLARLFSAYGLHHISTRYFRVFNSSFARIIDRYLDLMHLEKKILSLNILKNIFAIHYNLICTKSR